MDDFVNRLRGNSDGAGHGVLRDSHGLEVIFEENFAWGYGWLHVYSA